MNTNKIKRPRKPCGAIRCTMNINTPPSGRNGLKNEINYLAVDDKAYDGSGMNRFEIDEYGCWEKLTPSSDAKNL